MSKTQPAEPKTLFSGKKTTAGDWIEAVLEHARVAGLKTAILNTLLESRRGAVNQQVLEAVDQALDEMYREMHYAKTCLLAAKSVVVTKARTRGKKP